MPAEPSSDLTVSALERHWRIPAAPASTWIDAFRAGQETLAGLFPGMIADTDLDAMLERLVDIPGSELRCKRAARMMLQRETRMEWVVAWNLLKICAGMWLWVNGALLKQGVNSHNVTLGDWLHAAYVLLYESKDEKGRVAFESELMQAPRGEHVAVSAAQQRRSALAFAAD